MANAMRIGELARATGCRAETVRYYERERLLAPPPRTAGNYRLYGAAHLERLRFILNCRSLDMGLDEIRALIGVHDTPGERCGHVKSLLDAHIGHVERRVRQLRQLERELKALRGKCGTADHAAADCGIMHSLGHRAPARGHRPDHRDRPAGD